MTRSIGFIGLGAMGAPMARNTAAAGLDVHVFDLSASALEAARTWGANVHDDIASLAAEVELVVTVLPADDHVRGVVLGADGVLARPAPPAVLDFSTIGPWTFLEVRAAAERSGTTAFAGALTKGVAAAQDGTLALYLDDDVARDPRCMDVVGAISESFTLTGAPSTAKTVKLINNLLVGVNVALLAEAISVARKAGVDPADLLGALQHGSAASLAMRSHFMQYALADDLGPGRFSTRYIVKDLKLAAEMARRSGLTTFYGSLATSYYRGAMALGRADDYYPAVWGWTDLIEGGSAR